MRKGKLIAIEGIDCCGKETQSKILIKNLKKTGYETILFSFPRYETKIGKEIKQRLKKSSKTNIGALYTQDFLAAKPEIEKHLKKGYFVICDRYTPSNFAYQEEKNPGMPKPFFIIFLDLPPQLAENLKKNRKEKDAYEKNFPFLEKVYQRYKKLAKGERWLVIKCFQDEKILKKEEIAKKIWLAVRNTLNAKP